MDGDQSKPHALTLTITFASGQINNPAQAAGALDRVADQLRERHVWSVHDTVPNKVTDHLGTTVGMWGLIG